MSDESPIRAPSAFTPPDVRHLPLRVLYADAAIAVVVKPPELLSCPGTSTPNWDSVTARASQLFPKATGPLLAHRLDAPTSGLMVLALTPLAHRTLSQDFAQRLVHKEYDAICAPISVDVKPLLAGSSGTIALPVRLDWPRRPRQIVDAERGKPANTGWRVIGTHPIATDAVHIRLTPVTGRTHQLRVHMASGLSHPIVGDRLYGSDPDRALRDGDRLHLHASHLAFRHPETGAPMAFADPPDFLV